MRSARTARSRSVSDVNPSAFMSALSHMSRISESPATPAMLGTHLVVPREVPPCHPRHRYPDLREMHGNLSEGPLAHRGNSRITDGAHQRRHPPYLIAECILALLPFGCRYACNHVNPLNRRSARVAPRRRFHQDRAFFETQPQSSWVSAQPTPTGRLLPARERADNLSIRVTTFAEPVKPYTAAAAVDR